MKPAKVDNPSHLWLTGVCRREYRPRDRGRHREVRAAAGRPPGRPGGRGRLPGLPAQQRHLRPAPGRPQPDGADQVPLRRRQRRAAGAARQRRRPLQPGLGPPHHPPERPVPLRPARAGPGPAAGAGRGRPDHPRGLRRHRPQRHGLPPGRRLPLRGARHQPLGRGHLPSLPAPPVRPAPAPQVQDQLLGLRHRLRPGHVQRRGRGRRRPAPRRTARVEPGFRVFMAGGLGANPHPAQALEEFTAPGGPAARPSRPSCGPSTTSATGTTSCGPA